MTREEEIRAEADQIMDRLFGIVWRYDLSIWKRDAIATALLAQRQHGEAEGLERLTVALKAAEERAEEAEQSAVEHYNKAYIAEKTADEMEVRAKRAEAALREALQREIK